MEQKLKLSLVRPIVKMYTAFLYLLVLVVVTTALFIAYLSVTDYRPKASVLISSDGKLVTNAISINQSLSMLIWNIGYAGLGKERSFFYDGGDSVISSKDYVENNLKGIVKYITDQKETDFLLFQEVDTYSKRSHFENQRGLIKKALYNHESAFAINYQVPYIPMPFRSPLGEVNSGLLSFSKYTSLENIRYQFPGNYMWPKRLFFLDRCFVSHRYPVKNGKELIVINTHNSAYDDGTLREQQMRHLVLFLEEEYKKGNYVITGGDWNQTPPNFVESIFIELGHPAVREVPPVKKSFLPDWNWAFDYKTPTSRALKNAYESDKTPTTIIDYYLVSPNVEVVSVEGVDQGFQFSDHQPVELKFRLN